MKRFLRVETRLFASLFWLCRAGECGRMVGFFYFPSLKTGQAWIWYEPEVVRMLSMMNKTLWKKAIAFHGHECPGLAIGVKACEAVMQKMCIAPAIDEELVCVAETDACGIDAVQAILGCTFGKGNLLLNNTGKHAFSFFNRVSGERLRLYFRARYKTELECEQWQQHILNAAAAALFDFSKPDFPFPSRACVYPSIMCTSCFEFVSENRMLIYDKKPVCVSCFEKFNRETR
jgi:formylmethanofuran dehydrogenase subunit E